MVLHSKVKLYMILVLTFAENDSKANTKFVRCRPEGSTADTTQKQSEASDAKLEDKKKKEKLQSSIIIKKCCSVICFSITI